VSFNFSNLLRPETQEQVNCNDGVHYIPLTISPENIIAYLSHFPNITSQSKCMASFFSSRLELTVSWRHRFSPFTQITIVHSNIATSLFQSRKKKKERTGRLAPPGHLNSLDGHLKRDLQESGGCFDSDVPLENLRVSATGTVFLLSVKRKHVCRDRLEKLS
jgi:hypothetical protein